MQQLDMRKFNGVRAPKLSELSRRVFRSLDSPYGAQNEKYIS